MGHTICGDGSKKFVLSCFVEGLLSYSGEAALIEMKKLSAYPLEEYQFAKGSRRAVATDVPDVFASLYWRRDKALIYAVNLGAQKCAAHLKVDLMKIVWSAQKLIAYRSLGAKGGARVGDIAVRGIKVSLPALQSCLLKIA